MKANERVKYFPEYTSGDPEDRDVVQFDHDGLFTACEMKACGFTHILFRTEGAEVFLGCIIPKCYSSNSSTENAKCGDPTKKQEEDLRGEAINTEKARYTSAFLENPHSGAVVYLEGTAEGSFSFSRGGLFMCHVLSCREEELQVHFLWIQPWEIFTSPVIDWQFRLKGIHGPAKSSCMNLLTSPRHVFSILPVVLRLLLELPCISCVRPRVTPGLILIPYLLSLFLRPFCSVLIHVL